MRPTVIYTVASLIESVLSVTDNKTIRNIGTDYVNANGQLYHPLVAISYSDIFKRPIQDYETWTEICPVTIYDYDFTVWGLGAPADVWTVGQDNIEHPLYLVTMLDGTEDFDAIIIEVAIGFPFPQVVGTNVIIPLGMTDVYLSEVGPFNNMDHYANRENQSRRENLIILGRI